MFIGQNKILKELDIMVEVARENKDFSINILFQAPSGYGKTTLGLKFGNAISNKFIEGKFVTSGFQYMLGDINALNPTNRVLFIDEVHLLEIPEEIYPLMDSEEHIFILATNEFAGLKEPLVNRCIKFQFEKYSDDDLINIARNNLRIYSEVPDDFYTEIIKGGKKNPREIIVLCRRLNILLRKYPIENKEDLIKVLSEIINIKGGLDYNSRMYLEVLGKINIGSLKTISNMLGLQETAIKYEIEPYLLYLGKIKITSRGRELI